MTGSILNQVSPTESEKETRMRAEKRRTEFIVSNVVIQLQENFLHVAFDLMREVDPVAFVLVLNDFVKHNRAARTARGGVVVFFRIDHF